MLGECLAFLASGSDPTAIGLVEKVFSTDLVCTGHIYRCVDCYAREKQNGI